MLAGFLLLLCALAGVLSAAVLAANGPIGFLQTTTGTTTAPPPTTEPPAPSQVPPGVKISGVLVEYMTADQAELAVGEAFATPVPVRFGKRTFALDPNRYAVPQIRRAIAYALSARPGTTIRLPVTLQRDRVAAWAVTLAKRFDRRPVDSTLRLRKLRPWLTKDRPGRVLDRAGVSERDPRPPFLAQPQAGRRQGGSDQAGRHAPELRPHRRHPARVERAVPLQRHADAADLRCRHGPVELPDPARPLRDRRDGTESVVVSTRLRLGAG